MNPLERITSHRIETAAGYVLPEGAGPADWWLAVLVDPSASAQRRDEAARELRRLGTRAIREAQTRWRKIVGGLGYRPMSNENCYAKGRDLGPSQR
jgi:hypothetical protein